MPRFVAKEDVEKGLVDPKKPLAEQPEYKKKLEQEQKKKELNKPVEHKPKEHKPEQHKQNKQVKQKTQKPERKPKAEGDKHAQTAQGHQNRPKTQAKQKKPRRERQDRPKFNWDRKQITLQTPLPEAPKKLLPKPDSEKFHATLKKLKQQKDGLFEQRKKLIDQQRILIKSNSDTKKGGYNALSQYAGQLKEKNNLKNIIDGKIKKLQGQREKVQAKITQLKSQNGNLRGGSKDILLLSTEQLKDRIEFLEQRLSTANLTKKQESDINNSINESKRALLKARSDIEIKTQLSKNDDAIKILLDQSRSLKKQLDANYNEIKPLKKQIYDLLQKRKQQSGTITEVRSIQQIKAEYDLKIKTVDAKREQANKKMDQLRAKYNKQLDLWQDQQDLLKYIKYVQQQKAYKQKRKEEDQKWEKEKQQRQNKKKKQFEERQKKRQERIKQDEQRKQKEEERKQKLQKERDDYINRNPNWHMIDSCEFMIKYCNNIRPDTNQKGEEEKTAIRPEDIKLDKQKGWEKQVKSGCQVMQGKKTKHDQEAPKKAKKEKKVRPADQDGSLNHTLDTLNRFHELKVLPPNNVTEIDQTIKQLQDKIEILNKPTEEDVAAFKVKAEKQFDRIHGFHEQRQDEHHDQEKQVRHEKKRAEKVQLKGADFPGLN